MSHYTISGCNYAWMFYAGNEQQIQLLWDRSILQVTFHRSEVEVNVVLACNQEYKHALTLTLTIAFLILVWG